MIDSKETLSSETISTGVTDNELLCKYLNRIGEISILTHEEELLLSSKAAAGDESASKRLAEANLRFVVYVAKKYAGRGTPLRELISAGNLGLMQAVGSYRARQDARFAAYAIWWIKRHVLASLLDGRRVAHVPTHRLPEIARISEARSHLRDTNGREPDASEIAAYTGLGSQLVVSLCATAFGASSLETPIGGTDLGGDLKLGDIIADDSGVCPSATCEKNDAIGGLIGLLATLPERHASIVRAAYGIDTGLPLSNEEVGKIYKITRERVRQIQEEALRLLRKASREKDLPLTREEIKEKKRQDALTEVWHTFAAASHRGRAAEGSRAMC